MRRHLIKTHFKGCLTFKLNALSKSKSEKKKLLSQNIIVLTVFKFGLVL